MKGGEQKLADLDVSVFEKRLKNLREGLRGKNIEAALVTKRENYMYLSGFTGTSAFLLISHDKAVLITDFRYVEQAEKQAKAYEIIEYRGSLMAAVDDMLQKLKIGKLGFEEGYMTFDRYQEFKSKLDVKEFVPLEGIIEKLRIIKDQEEIDIIKQAVKIADEAFSHILKFIKPGILETEIAAELEYFMKKQGATGASFETIIASGERSSMPHGVASLRKIQSGDPITMDYGAYFEGYCSDMTRTVFVGSINDEIKKIYNIVLEAQKKAAEGAFKGLTGKQIDAIARDVIAGKGFGDHFGHGLGHGVGLEIHEDPRLSPSGNTVMENGMVVTVEPGIYVNGFGGVRIEDIIVIHDDTPVVLTQSTKEIIVL